MGYPGPPAPPPLEPRQMVGRLPDPRPGLKDMKPMLLAGLADLISTEAVRRFGTNPTENNPLIRSLQVKGSNAPAMAAGTLLEALLFHAIQKTHPDIGRLLATTQAASSGTMAGQNLSLLDKDPARSDDRLSVWTR